MKHLLDARWKKAIFICLIFILGIPLFLSLYRDLSRRPVKETHFRMGRIKRQLLKYKDACGSFPNALSQISEPGGCAGWKPPEEPIRTRDKWGAPLMYSVDEKGDFHLLSYGLGGKRGGIGASQDIKFTSELSEGQIRELKRKQEKKKYQKADGFRRVKCQNRPKKGSFGQSSLQLAIRRMDPANMLAAYMVLQSWQGTKVFNVNVNLQSGQGWRSQRKVFVGKEFHFKINRITNVSNKWRGELKAKLISPGDEDDDFETIQEIMICQLN